MWGDFSTSITSVDRRIKRRLLDDASQKRLMQCRVSSINDDRTTAEDSRTEHFPEVSFLLLADTDEPTLAVSTSCA